MCPYPLTTFGAVRCWRSYTDRITRNVSSSCFISFSVAFCVDSSDTGGASSLSYGKEVFTICPLPLLPMGPHRAGGHSARRPHTSPRCRHWPKYGCHAPCTRLLLNDVCPQWACQVLPPSSLQRFHQHTPLPAAREPSLPTGTNVSAVMKIIFLEQE